MIAYIIIGALSGMLLVLFLMTLVCFLLVFYSPKRKTLGPDEFEIPKGEIYEVYRDKLDKRDTLNAKRIRFYYLARRADASRTLLRVFKGRDS